MYFSDANGQLNITPSGIVYVTENSRLTISCSYTGSSSYTLVNWVKDGGTVYSLYSSNCIQFAGEEIDPNVVEVNCTNNGKDFTLTFKQVKKEQDEDRWSCNVYTSPLTISTDVTIKIKGRLISVN